MSTNLTVTVGGESVPLEECGWIQRRPCGCIVSAVVAVVDAVDESGWVLATADQAHQHLNRTKRERERAAKAGLQTELITMTHYREHIGANWECEQHATAEAAS
jgi:RPA family protein